MSVPVDCVGIESVVGWVGWLGWGWVLGECCYLVRGGCCYLVRVMVRGWGWVGLINLFFVWVLFLW